MSIQHYGVKGMKWGVRRYRSKSSKVGAVVRKAMVGDESKSLATARGRKGFKANVKADIAAGKKALSILSNTKTFKLLVYNKDSDSIVTSKGRKKAKAAIKKQIHKFEKKQLKAQQSDIAKAKKKGNLKEAKALQDEIDDLYGKDLSPWED